MCSSDLRESGLKQAEISRLSLLDTPTINRLYSGRQTEGIRHIYALAAVLDIDPLPLALHRLGMDEQHIGALLAALNPEALQNMRETISRIKMTVI